MSQYELGSIPFSVFRREYVGLVLFIKYLVLSFTLYSVHYVRNRKVNTS